MNFKQYEDGSCDIEFSKEEIKIINKKNKIHLSDEMLRHFGNKLVEIVSNWNSKFKKETYKKLTYPNTEIKGE
jgi:predicted nuclease of restriction endonuclease-like RecB superfamily